jgi:hypothetical protein
MKICVKCKILKPITDFRLSSKAEGSNYRRPECYECEKKYQKTRNRKERAKMRPILGTPCQCCGKSDKALVYDHQHIDNKFRGWICQSCNIGIGRLGDCIEGVEKALIYLKNIIKI